METDTIKEFKIVCIAVLIICICEAGSLFLRPDFSPITTIAFIRSAQIIFLILLLVLTPGGLKFAGLSKRKGFAGFKTGLIWSFLFGIAAFVTSFILYLTGTNPLQFIHSNPPRDDLILFFLTGGLISPIAEEIFFRGIFYSFLRRLGILTAIFFSTSVFALFHLSNGGLPVFQIVGGLVFALSFEYSKSLVTPIVIHVLGNMAIFSITLIVADYLFI